VSAGVELPAAAVVAAAQAVVAAAAREPAQQQRQKKKRQRVTPATSDVPARLALDPALADSIRRRGPLSSAIMSAHM
jgi:hypothetical protein